MYLATSELIGLTIREDQVMPISQEVKQGNIKLDLLRIGNDLVSIQMLVIMAQANYSESSENYLDLSDIHKRLEVVQDLVSRKLNKAGK